jgi:hypothetical protein
MKIRVPVFADIALGRVYPSPVCLTKLPGRDKLTGWPISYSVALLEPSVRLGVFDEDYPAGGT